jgi:hypothetical protein
MHNFSIEVEISNSSPTRGIVWNKQKPAIIIAALKWLPKTLKARTGCTSRPVVD